MFQPSDHLLRFGLASTGLWSQNSDNLPVPSSDADVIRAGQANVLGFRRMLR